MRDLLAADDATRDLDLLLLAVVERAPVDSEVADEVDRAMRDFDAAVQLTLSGAAIADGTSAGLAYALTATILGLRMRARTAPGTAGASTVLVDRIHPPRR